MKMMDMKFDDKQQRLLDIFFTEQVKVWNPEVWSTNFVAILLIVIAMLADVLPFTIWEGDYETLLIMGQALIMGLELYVERYCVCMENGVQKKVYDRLKYLPISSRQLYLYRMKKLGNLCFKLTMVGVVAQNLLGIGFSHSWSVTLILVPILWTFVCPMCFLGIINYFRK